ncbi:MAG TPA: alpha/beta hydrolase [Variovorax sp.]|nr:alpha/beta hydrolase [Variovorax sp.]
MTPIRFGPPSRRLFGILHPADERRPTASAVLLCNPFGHEALRVHRFYRLLADRLSRQGVTVLRFDYHGTGDSPGEDEDAELNGWTQDILEAQRELLRSCGARQLSCFGSRLGARLALMAAPQAAGGLHKLVLWDTIFDGRAYLEELGRAHLDELELGYNTPDPRWRSALERDPLAFAGECLGFAIPPRLREQLLSLSPATGSKLPSLAVRLLADPQDAPAARWAGETQALNPGTQLTLSGFRHPLIWTSNPFASNEMVPAEALARMVDELHGP